jgi:hypothetical protein
VLVAASVVSADASPVRARTAACPRLAEAAALPRWPRGGRLVGDIDGDGIPDRVVIRYSRNSLASCGFLLVVKTHRSLLATRIPEGDQLGANLTIRDWRSLASDGDPYLAAIVRLASNREQIVVSRWHGASVANVILYGAVGPTSRSWAFGRGCIETSCPCSVPSAPAKRTRAARPVDRSCS